MKKLTIAALILIGAVAALYISSWAPRQLNTMHGRLYGQWLMRAKSPQEPPIRYYFGPIDQASGKGTYIQTIADVQLHGSYKLVSESPEKNTLRVKLEAPDTDALVLGQGLVIKPGLSVVELFGGKRVDLKAKLQERILTIPTTGASMRVESEALIVRYGARHLDYVNAKTHPDPLAVQDIKDRALSFGALL